MKYNQSKVYIGFFLFVIAFAACVAFSIKHPPKESIRTFEYEVQDVKQYMAEITGYHGGVYGYEKRYSFDYETSDGEVKTINDYSIDDKRKVVYGDCNKYTVKISSIYGITKECLYIKREWNLEL